MKEIRLIVSLTPEEIKDRLEATFGLPETGKPAFYRTGDRQFCHVKPHASSSSVLFTNRDGIDPIFVGIHLKDLGERTQITISPMTSGYLLAAKLLLIPAIWLIAPPLAIYYQGWGVVPKLLLACTSIQLLFWLFARSFMNDERKIVKTIRETFHSSETVEKK